MTNPFIYGLHDPVGAFSDLAVLCLFLAVLVVVVWALTGNVIAIYHEWDTGGWSVLPPAEWVARLALVPFAVAIAAWLIAAMFSMLG